MVGALLATIETGVQWWIGDYWNYRHQALGEKKCGPEVGEQLGISYQTVRQCGDVSRKYQHDIRISCLPFGHHQAIAYEEEIARGELLQWAVDYIKEYGKPPAIIKLKAERNRRLLESSEYRIIYADPPWKYQDEQVIATLSYCSTKCYT